MTRRRLAIVFLPTALVLLLTGAMYWLLHTQSGARWLWSRAAGFVPGSLSVSELSGDLETGLKLRGLKFEDESIRLGVGEVNLRLDFSLFPLTFNVDSLAADEVTVQTLDVADDDADPAELLTALALPFPVSFGDIRVERLLVADPGGESLFEAAAIHCAGNWHERLMLEDAELTLDGLEMQISGNLGFTAPFPVEAAIAGRFEPVGNETFPPPGTRLESRLEGNLELMTIEASLEPFSASLQGEVSRVLENPVFDLLLSAAKLEWPPDQPDPPWSLHSLTAQLTGTLDDYRVSAGSTLDLDNLSAYNLSLEGSGNLAGLSVEDFRLTGETDRLQASGTLGWAEGFAAELSSVIESFDLHPWIQEWPEQQTLRGTLDATWGGERLELTNIELLAGDSGFRAGGRGVFDPLEEVMEAEIGWTGLHWPLGSGQPAFRSTEGRLKLNGRPDNWNAAGSLQLQTGDWPGSRITLNGSGDLDKARVTIEQGELLGGRFAGEFSYQWSGSQPWTASIQAQGLDPSPLAPAYPGSLSATVRAGGQLEPLQVEIDITELNGQLRERPVSARGEIAFQSGQVYARGLNIQSGESRVTLDGSAREPEGIGFSGRIDSLADFIPDTAGSVEGEGRLSLNAEQPLLKLNLQASDLQFSDVHIGTAAAKPPGGEPDHPGIRLEVSGLEVGDQLIDSLSLTSSSQILFEQVEIEAQRAAVTLQAHLTGQLLGWSEMPETSWTGQLESMTVSSESLGYLKLVEATRVTVESRSAQLEPACFRGPRDGRACVDLKWTEAGQLLAHASLDAISMELMQLATGNSLDFSQTLSGVVQWEKDPGSKPAAEVRMVLTPGRISRADGSAELLTGEGYFGFQIQDGRLLSGTLDLTLPGTGVIDTDFSVPDMSLGVNSPVEGRVLVSLDTIEPFLDWIPALDGLAGTINADVRIAGTAADPRLTGHASLVRGRIEHQATGLTISDIRLAGAVYEYDYTELNGSFTSGEGQGRIKAAVKFDKILKPEITLELNGDNLTLVNIPDMTVKANPDLKVRWQDGALDLNGSIFIPTARISPRYLPTTSASESPDLQIVAGEKPLTEEPAFDSSRLRINGSVSVELGKDITVSFERATATLSGKTVFTWQDNLIPMGDGAYTVSGKITAYGQLLEVSEGRVSFPKVPADNPYLNITAEREIYGNVQVKKAIVLITGTVKRPVLEVYTEPVTTEERALALLITGHDFDYDQGVGGVEVGLYIAPRLYVSYGVGLFESQSVISARYDLKHGFGIKATSGQRETGVDISYTIEK